MADNGKQHVLLWIGCSWPRKLKYSGYH